VPWRSSANATPAQSAERETTVTKKLSPADIVIIAGGAVMLIGSFLPFYSYASISFSAWSGAHSFGLFGISTVAVICGVVMAGQIAISDFAGSVTLPSAVLGLTWDQVHLALGFQAAILMLAFLARNSAGASRGIGFWLMLLAGITLLAGAVMRTTGVGTRKPL
jgi:hypothetical protein